MYGTKLSTEGPPRHLKVGAMGVRSGRNAAGLHDIVAFLVGKVELLYEKASVLSLSLSLSLLFRTLHLFCGTCETVYGTQIKGNT